MTGLGLQSPGRCNTPAQRALSAALCNYTAGYGFAQEDSNDLAGLRAPRKSLDYAAWCEAGTETCVCVAGAIS